MMRRCYKIGFSAYPPYGGQGITVCKHWHTFANFYADMGERPEGKTLDRIDNAGNYEPSNCRWATPKEQSQNRRSVRLMTYAGETMNMSDWASRLGITKTALSRRIEAGWPLERALTVPQPPRYRNLPSG